MKSFSKKLRGGEQHIEAFSEKGKDAKRKGCRLASSRTSTPPSQPPGHSSYISSLSHSLTHTHTHSFDLSTQSYSRGSTVYLSVKRKVVTVKWDEVNQQE